MTDLFMNIKGTKVPVYVVPEDDRRTMDRGMFAFDPGGEEPITAPTWGELRSQLTRLAEGEVAVPFELIRKQRGANGMWTLRGTARNNHTSRHRVVLVTWEGGAKDQAIFADTVRPMPDAVRDELERLLTERERLTAQIEEIKAAGKIDLWDAVRDEQAARVAQTGPVSLDD